jgi:hypothetical protein
LLFYFFLPCLRPALPSARFSASPYSFPHSLPSAIPAVVAVIPDRRPASTHQLTPSGYTTSCHTIVTAARDFTAQLRTRFPLDLFVLGDPRITVVAFGSNTVNIYAVGDAMGKKGWHLNALRDPGALHMAFTVGRGA